MKSHSVEMPLQIPIIIIIIIIITHIIKYNVKMMFPGRQSLFPFRKQAIPFLTVDAVIGNKLFKTDDAIYLH